MGLLKKRKMFFWGKFNNVFFSIMQSIQKQTVRFGYYEYGAIFKIVVLYQYL